MSFVPDFPILLSFSLAVFLLVITPGPDMLFFLSTALNRSRLAAFVAMSGAMCGVLVHSILVAVGVSALIAASPNAFLVLKWVGALYLVWLAVQVVRSSTVIVLAQSEPFGALGAVYVKGVLINLLNPKVIFFFLTFLPQFVRSDDVDASAKMMFLGILSLCIAMPVSAVIILFADHLAAWMRRSPDGLRVLNWVFAFVLCTFAVRLIFLQAV